MAKIIKLNEANIPDGAGDYVMVGPGRQVELLPPSKSDEMHEDGINLPPKLHENTLLQLQNNGPYTIAWIGRWPCGRIMLFFKMQQGREPGAFASQFKPVS